MASDPEHYLVILKVDGESKNVLPLDKKERQVTHRLPALIVNNPCYFSCCNWRVTAFTKSASHVLLSS